LTSSSPSDPSIPEATAPPSLEVDPALPEAPSASPSESEGDSLADGPTPSSSVPDSPEERLYGVRSFKPALSKNINGSDVAGYNWTKLKGAKSSPAIPDPW
jgi:hypothetical protein